MTHLNDITTDTNVSTRSKGSHLTIDDRVKISVLKELEYSNRMIAQYIGVAHGTIDREIKRGMVTKRSKQSNNGKVYCYYKEYYDPYTAQERYEKRRSNCGRTPMANCRMRLASHWQNKKRHCDVSCIILSDQTKMRRYVQ
ncbi:helix-turn-helix domain-containing protein [Limosilactobacillus fermentum]|nr:helix-turn-helix domain-containing protein [Limosilactobacillus fermentum]WEB66094.1 helix-turn-helix domain-containing protein [Limosilactobacillus fermentum]WEB66151.1 helix-turn-helix domain-containing protein [Limosilactobacillus fermentum]WEB66211.1 helix-turn-helix domain-containing protein [Limosilactobacillus fermentum]WEB66503.1 helix-turn-helix domain-containing protein [Limosilactobacillus fermentum]WEB66508.1 helix-turn-helix domain-containing protein [Limosilactobacillus fermen